MATTVTIMHDTQTHATVLINANGALPLEAGTITMASLGDQLDAFGNVSTVDRRIAITKIESSCGPSAAAAPNTGYTINYGGAGGNLFIHEGSFTLDGLNLIMAATQDVKITPRDASVSFSAILTLKKIRGFAGSASMA